MSQGRRLHNAMGLCMKAGKCRSGDFVCEKVLKEGKARLVLLDDTASENTKMRYQTLCRTRNVPILIVKELGHAIGRPGRMVAVVLDESFSNMIQDAAASDISEIAGV